MSRRSAPVDPAVAMLLALAGRAKEAQLYWQAGLAAARARGEVRGHTEAFAHHVEAEMCLLTALRAAPRPAGLRVNGIALPRDPVAAMRQLREHAVGYAPRAAIEAAHEPARLAYRAAFAAPLTVEEQQLVAALAALPVARRDKVIETAETLSR
ncbi:hypothetical protein [Actinoplanes sp. DH11]|uniref:hypothetical protein n=1 Tax=Actinoplanes sp. DH11 TaxID=2857011 RepID=UPI001E4ADB26|nr:hypothetical protein [Actinoplanes sp. DH11]